MATRTYVPRTRRRRSSRRVSRIQPRRRRSLRRRRPVRRPRPISLSRRRRHGRPRPGSRRWCRRNPWSSLCRPVPRPPAHISIDLRRPIPPRSLDRPRLDRLTTEARRTLRQRGLLSGVWADRLAGADERLIRFLNRFHRVSGFEHLLRDHFAGPYQRAVARFAMRLAQLLASRHPGFARTMSFERVVGYASGGIPVYTVEITHDGIRYSLYPASRLDGPALERTFWRNASLFQHPAQVRWVFDGTRLGMGRRQVVETLQRTLARGRPGPGLGGSDRRWLASLDRIVTVI